MFLSKSGRQSARIFGNVLDEPLYGGDCSAAACESLVNGNVEGAIAEWRRLADLGSSRARCVLSYLYFRGAPSIAADLEEARRLAGSAVEPYALSYLGAAAADARSWMAAFVQSVSLCFITLGDHGSILRCSPWVRRWPW
jgi:hypothetical protein